MSGSQPGALRGSLWRTSKCSTQRRVLPGALGGQAAGAWPGSPARAAAGDLHAARPAQPAQDAAVAQGGAGAGRAARARVAAARPCRRRRGRRRAGDAARRARRAGRGARRAGRVQRRERGGPDARAGRPCLPDAGALAGPWRRPVRLGTQRHKASHRFAATRTSPQTSRQAGLAARRRCASQALNNLSRTRVVMVVRPGAAFGQAVNGALWRGSTCTLFVLCCVSAGEAS